MFCVCGGGNICIYVIKQNTGGDKNEYIKYIQDGIDKDPSRVNDNAEKIAKSNLGYFAGYYSKDLIFEVFFYY